ncbi:MAG: putative DNA-binding domain-containing protein [Myxococcaceae bacterium]
MSLSALQTLLARAIAAPGTVQPEALGSSIVPHPPLDAVARAGIYADMYRARLQDALRSDFPNLARLLGDEGFFELSAAYADVHGSTHSDIGQFGQGLSDFLQTHPGPRGDEAALAQLEWALAQAFTAKDAAPTGQEALGQLGEAAIEARLRFVPALNVLVLSHDVLALWEQLEAESEAWPAPDSRPVSVAVWRKGFQVLHRALAPAEAEAVQRAQGGATLAVVCEAFSEGEDAAKEAFATLSAWFQDGWVLAVESA